MGNALNKQTTLLAVSDCRREEGGHEKVAEKSKTFCDEPVSTRRKKQYIIIGTLQAAVVIGVARVLFDLPVTGNLWALLLAVPVYTAAHLILGFAFSARAESQLQAIQGAVFFSLPSMLLSGFMFPFQGMPAWARIIGNMLPLTHFVRATRGILLKGAGASLVVSEMVPVALFALIAATVALAAYRRHLE